MCHDSFKTFLHLSILPKRRIESKGEDVNAYSNSGFADK